MEKEIHIVGRVLPESTEKKHNNQEVIKGGVTPTIKSTAYKGLFKVLKRWRRDANRLA